LSLYADKYLSFGFHVQKNTNPTGRLFHQILNEHVWLLFSSLAFSCVASYMTDEQKERIISQVFEPMLEMFTVKYSYDFDRIHNHGIWAVAAVGICGLAIGQPKYLDMAVYGLKHNGTGGFLAQISELFSPSGYYMEGPYYHRYAIRPTCVFAEVLSRHMPELEIFKYKGGVIGKTVKALLATAYPNGEFPALNDASRTMSICDRGVQVAVSQYAHHYHIDDNILGMAKIQNSVWLNICGLTLSKAYEATPNIGLPCWPSVELSEGKLGDKGAQGFLRMPDKDDVFQLVMNYGQHGMGHGHFDTLGISYFNRHHEVLCDYGYGRWVNVEPKFGGRYLPENKSYARQTIAHNVVTIDEACQNHFDSDEADAVHGEKHFFTVVNDSLRAVSAFSNDSYDGCAMQRAAFLLKVDELESPLLIDLFKITSGDEHQYDYAHQYNGQIVLTNFDYETHSQVKTLGDNDGYQHLWRMAEGDMDKSSSAKVSWLQDHSYYTWNGCSSNTENKIIFTRTGASDPAFNLRNVPSFILRTKGQSTLFASALETHGYFDEEFEQSVNARGLVQSIQVLGTNDEASVVEILTEKTSIIVMLSHKVTPVAQHKVTFNDKTYTWTGDFNIEQGERA